MDTFVSVQTSADGNKADVSFDAAVNLMDAELCEKTVGEFDHLTYSAQAFVDRYAIRHKETFGEDFIVN